jgi:hypothetical protein
MRRLKLCLESHVIRLAGGLVPEAVLPNSGSQCYFRLCLRTCLESGMLGAPSVLRWFGICQSFGGY